MPPLYTQSQISWNYDLEGRLGGRQLCLAIRQMADLSLLNVASSNPNYISINKELCCFYRINQPIQFLPSLKVCFLGPLFG